jgi:uncharacterized membrane protein (UPF0127 family)
MRRPIYLLGFLLLLASGAIFYRTATAPGEQTPPDATFGGVSLTLDLATSTASREQGLGGRSSLPRDHGMLFVFEKLDQYGIWMKDMHIPIDIFWLDDKRQVVYLAQDVSPETYPDVFYPSMPALYVLETNAGFAREHSITVGTVLELKNLTTVSK